jgi:hypothetical protein
MTFIPAFSYVSNITNSCPPVVTTTTNHTLNTGMVARMRIPFSYGMQQLNNQIFSVTVLSPTTVSLQYTQAPQIVNVDSTNFNAFVNAGQPNQPQIVSVGAGASPLNNTPGQQLNGECQTLLNDQVYNNSTFEIPY